MWIQLTKRTKVLRLKGGCYTVMLGQKESVQIVSFSAF